MNERVEVSWRIVHHDVSHLYKIESSCYNISCYEQPRVILRKRAQTDLTFLRVDFAVYEHRVKPWHSCLNELVHSGRNIPTNAEDDSAASSKPGIRPRFLKEAKEFLILETTNRNEALSQSGHKHTNMTYTMEIWKPSACAIFMLLADRSRGQDCLRWLAIYAALVQLLQHLVRLACNAIGGTQHRVRLVDCQPTYRPQRHTLLLDVVQQTLWRGDEQPNIGFPEGAFLRSVLFTPGQSKHPWRHHQVTDEIGGYTRDLVGQLFSRHQHECLRLGLHPQSLLSSFSWAELSKPLNHREQEGQGLPRTSLGAA
mmetsp:Transcript_31102/g.75615  ORF Transcript_31102/g.75615 Transcript_31102/m.75615 type:complete len:312 (+) Transcript_31102:710-1645(+)